MQGPIAQTIGLTIAGNALLQDVPLDNFWPDSSVFTFCRNVRFGVWDSASGRGTMLAENPIDWLRQTERDATGFRVRVIRRDRSEFSDRMSVGFVGGGSRWLIESAHADGRSWLWQDQWEVRDRDAPDQRIWSVIYWRMDEALSPVVERSVETVSIDLADALVEIADFADRCGSSFAGNFRAGLSALQGSQVSIWHKDLALPGLLSTHAERLLDACQAAWVFGGMGSWNDGAYWGEFTEEGDRLSDRLFDLLQEGSVVAANSTFPRALREG